MTVIAGIDLSTTSTGLALVTVSGTMECSIETKIVGPFSGKRADSLEDRYRRIDAIKTGVLDWVGTPRLVVIETLFERSRGGSLLDRAGLWWSVTGALIARGVPIVAVAPTQAKKFATGTGGADKGRMVLSASRLWQDWEPSTAKGSEDEADAVALASIGTALVGFPPFPMTEYRNEIIGKLVASMGYVMT